MLWERIITNVTTRLTQAILPTNDERWTFDYATAIDFTKTTLATLGDNDSEQAPYVDFVKSLYETNPEPFDEVCKRQVAHFEQLMTSATSHYWTRLLRKVRVSIYFSSIIPTAITAKLAIFHTRDDFASLTTTEIRAMMALPI